MKMQITIDNINKEQASAIKGLFLYMEYLGNIGSSRNCCIFSDGDGSFRPKIKIKSEKKLLDKEFLFEKGIKSNGDFHIDEDSLHPIKTIKED